MYCRIVHHHDHTSDIEHGTFHYFLMRNRFSPAAICEDCNMADAKAKKIIGAPDWFSFSPREIGYFCRLEADGRPQPIDGLVRSVWESPLVREHVGLIERAENWFLCFPQHMSERPPKFYSPFDRNSPPTADGEYFQDGYIRTFSTAMDKLGIFVSDPVKGFSDFCQRSGGSNRG